MTNKKQQSTKKKQSKKVTNYPERNTAAETIIQLGSLGILLTVPFIMFISLIALFFNDTSNKMVGSVVFFILLFCINVSVQCVLTLRELNRVDRYWQRSTATIMIFLAPVAWAMLQPAVDNQPLLHFVTVSLAFVGSLWLWALLLIKKDKLVWVLK